MQLDNLPQRLDPVIVGIQRHKPGVPAIADVNGADRRRAIRYRLPDPNTRKLLTGSLRQRDSAGVETGMIGRLRRDRLNQMHRKLALG